MRVGTAADAAPRASHLLLSDEEYSVARTAFERSYGELAADPGVAFWPFDARVAYLCGSVRRALDGHRAGRSAS